METLSIIIFTAIFSALALVTCYLDVKYQWRLNDWMNGRCSNPFAAGHSSSQQELQQKDAQISALQARIETLEAIVTEPAYELDKKINALK